jgi:hypothetical protein
MLSSAPAARRIKSFEDTSKLATTDKYLFDDMRANGVVPADKTNDLTGRIPTPDRVLSFTSDKSADKCAKLIDELLTRPECGQVDDVLRRPL